MSRERAESSAFGRPSLYLKPSEQKQAHSLAASLESVSLCACTCVREILRSPIGSDLFRMASRESKYGTRVTSLGLAGLGLRVEDPGQTTLLLALDL